MVASILNCSPVICVASSDTWGNARPRRFWWTVCVAWSIAATTPPAWRSRTAPAWRSSSSRGALEGAGQRFITETATETLAHLIEDAAGDTLEERVIAALAHVEGTYGLAVMSTDEPGKIVVARRGSPVLLGIGEDELFVASDASAVLEHTRSVVYLDDGDIAVLTADGYHVVDAESHVQLREVDDVAWDLAEIELGGYPHFMLKEISEQAETVRATLRGRLLQDRGTARLHGLNLTP